MPQEYSLGEFTVLTQPLLLFDIQRRHSDGIVHVTPPILMALIEQQGFMTIA